MMKYATIETFHQIKYLQPSTMNIQFAIHAPQQKKKKNIYIYIYSYFLLCHLIDECNFDFQLI